MTDEPAQRPPVAVALDELRTAIDAKAVDLTPREFQNLTQEVLDLIRGA